jgi:hypothetical protein
MLLSWVENCQLSGLYHFICAWKIIAALDPGGGISSCIKFSFHLGERPWDCAVELAVIFKTIIRLMMAAKPHKRRSERLNRRKSTLINKVHELAEFCDVDIALIIRSRKSGQYFTYNSLDLESWPPSKEQIASY